ncbi:MAG: response regulator [Candidatus Aminicenantes bacterium]|nr:response regulator [Candidatus Aminicenantes bacterium]
MNPRNPVILCVDDEEANLKLLANILIPRGYTVVSAASGKDALLKIKSQAIDLVLLDIIMPGMDGFEVCRQIKGDQKLRNIPVILITVLTAKKDRIRGIKAGADEFLSKPFDQTEALARIKILMKVKKLNDECKHMESQREAALEALKKSNDELECRVRERTAELAQANKILKTDIIERKRAEEMIRSSLEEKEVLLKEVHHRVKNNLMTLIGLIKMQEAKADNVTFSDLLQELEGRVRAMAMVHESLHKSADLAHVNLQNYIETLGAHICAQFGADREISFSVQVAGVDVGLDIAVPCGLILNELITNACKHAFPAGQPGEIRITFQKCRDKSRLVPTNNTGTSPPTYELTVADNGVGLPAKVNWKNPETVGLQLVKMLSQQINGSIKVDLIHGTAFHLRFAKPSQND